MPPLNLGCNLLGTHPVALRSEARWARVPPPEDYVRGFTAEPASREFSHGSRFQHEKFCPVLLLTPLTARTAFQLCSQIWL